MKIIFLDIDGVLNSEMYNALPSKDGADIGRTEDRM